MRVRHLCPEMHAMGKMAKNHQRAGNSDYTLKVAPWILAKMGKLAILGEVANLDGESQRAGGLAIQIRWQKVPP